MTISNQDLQKIWERNGAPPEPVQKHVHDFILETIAKQPRSPAIDAWDATFTYAELDKLSSGVANNLKLRGIRPDDLIPLCFEKSAWTYVAMLGVMKAGAAFVGMDVKQPEERLKTIVHQIQPKVILASTASSALAERICSANVEVEIISRANVEAARTQGVLTREETSNSGHNDIADPSNLLYVVFTSGSTGTPKGVRVTHQAFSTAMVHQIDVLKFRSGLRVLEFASYAFDLAWYITLFTLASGGCLCVGQGDEMRNNPAKCIADYQIQSTAFTPSLARELELKSMSLEVMILAGEAVTKSDVHRLEGRVGELFNIYGPSECTPVSTIAQIIPIPEDMDVPSIGQPLGHCIWIVDPDDHTRLMPLGEEGELLLEGPLLTGAGYLNDPGKTAIAFINDPPWLLKGAEGRSGRHGRLYKTGDLVRCNPDGSLAYVGRKDAQVKIRGQRVELSEVEYHLELLFSVSEDNSKRIVRVVAEVFTPRQSKNPILAAFINITNHPQETTASSNEENSWDKLRKDATSLLRGVPEQLASQLPVYMIPSCFIPIEGLPIGGTGKTDRKKLRQLGSTYSLEELAGFTGLEEDRGEKVKPSTAMERTLQALWSTVLGIDASTIGANDSFLRLGGDSIQAMRLVRAAEASNISISVAGIFQQPRLLDLAKVATVTEEKRDKQILPFSLLRDGIEIDVIKTQAGLLCGIEPEQVQDVYPCTSLQQGLLAMTEKRPGDYMSKNVFPINKSVDLKHLQKAVELVVKTHPILRTRIIDLPGQGLVQVVADEAVDWTPHSLAMSLGTRLSRFCYLHDTNESVSLCWEIHHAVYDGWSLPLLLTALNDAYHGRQLLHPVPYQTFIDFVQNIDEKEATNFWREQLESSDAQVFPSLPSGYNPRIDQFMERSISNLSWSRSEITPSTSIRTAWAMAQSSYTNSRTVSFGATVMGRQIVPGASMMTGPTIATIPVTTHLDSGKSIAVIQQEIQQQSIASMPYEQFGLQEIRKISPEAEQACSFQTLLVVQLQKESLTLSKELSESSSGLQLAGQVDSFNTYALLIECEIKDDGVYVTYGFDSNIIDESKMERISVQFERYLRLVCSGEEQTRELNDVEAIGDHDLNDLWTWNLTVPEASESLVQDLLKESIDNNPDSLAVDGWDGTLTYRQWDEYADSLARMLSDMGIGAVANSPVLLCFKRSKWMHVATLAVMRASGVAVPVDPKQPEERLRTIMKQIEPKVVLTMESLEPLVQNVCLGHSAMVQIVDASRLDSNLGAGSLALQRTPKVDDLLYIVFTSGSTGTPKGVMITQRNFSTALHHQAGALSFVGRRLLDCISYAFDASWLMCLGALRTGGTVCIASQEELNDSIGACILKYNITYGPATPSMARAMEIEALNNLEVMNLGGEALTKADLERFRGIDVVNNCYGPSECTPVSSYIVVKRGNETITPTIGRGIGASMWVVDPNDENRLVPIGAEGELYIEGPLVGPGYYNNAEKTAASFVEDPAWLLKGGPNGQPGRRGRLYKTGDLVRFTSNGGGDMDYVARKDSQVKIRGQRVELAEVEHHVHKFMKANIEDKDIQIIAEVVTPNQGSQTLLAFISVIGLGEEELNNKLASIVATLDEQLSEVLPSYMVPTAFIAIAGGLPTTTTGKTDRKKLRDMGNAMSTEEIAALAEQRRGEYQEPSGELQQALQSMWASLLHISSETISATDSFLRIGGDSIQAMRLVAMARQRGFVLSATEVFKRPRLCDLAGTITRIMEDSDSEIEDLQIQPFSLLGSQGKGDASIAQRNAAELCENVSIAQVEDIYPCTPLQEGLLAMTEKRPGDYISRNVFKLKRGIDIEKFMKACEALVKQHAILRTRIVDLLSHGLMQIVIDETAHWASSSELQSMGLGTALNRFQIVTDQNLGLSSLVWDIHHALYDGWTMQILLETLESIYSDSWLISAELCPYQTFIAHGQLEPAAGKEFWIEKCQGIEASTFPSLPTPGYMPQADQTISRTITLDWHKDAQFTPAVTVKTAWAMIQSLYTASNDVSFGNVSSGRQVPVANIDQMAGPTIATVPVRFQLDPEATVTAIKYSMQQFTIDSIPFEQMGLQEIRKLSTEAARACDFQTLLLIQPSDKQPASSILFEEIENSRGYLDGFATYGMMVICELLDDGLNLSISFDTEMINANGLDIDRMASQFEHLVHILNFEESQKLLLKNIPLAGEVDLMEIWTWNRRVPPITHALVHDLIAETVRKQPDRIAIDAWDGSITYKQLDDLTTHMANRLTTELAIGPGSLVPLCVDKSMLTMLGMLAVMKSGAAFVAMDVNQPEQRLKTIMEESQPTVILTTSRQRDLSLRLCPSDSVAVVTLSRSGLDITVPKALSRNTDPPRLPTPADLLYVIFTSGSTGTPKGAMVSHQSFASALTYQADNISFIKPESRVLDFVSYAFDMAWFTCISALRSGACICIRPNHELRNDPVMSMEDANISFILLTPSLGRELDLPRVQTLDTVVFIGEALLSSDVSRLSGIPTVYNTYGPAECTPVSTVALMTEKDRFNTPSIGVGEGVCTWVVDTENDRLAPVGTEGELWLEGPLVGLGYLKDESKTAESFISDPRWLMRGVPGRVKGRQGRLYKTGDTVKYNHDGSLSYVTRKGTQVKVRGQRVELGEVEHHIRKLISSDADIQVAAEVITPHNGNTALLAAFFSILGDMPEEVMRKAVSQATSGLLPKLEAEVPSSMVPSIFIPIPRMPMTISGKTDRKQLRIIGGKLTEEDIFELSSGDRISEYREPTSPMEVKLRDLWAVVLKLHSSSISVNDNFLRIGGDSIQAMRLVAAARLSAIHFTVADIFKNPKLCELALVAEIRDTPGSSSTVQLIEPFSMLSPNINIESAREQVSLLCNVPKSAVQDIFPCSSLQEGLMAMTEKRPGDYVAYYEIVPRSNTDLKRLQAACEEIVAEYPILRTRIVDLPGQGLVQVILDQNIEWKAAAVDEPMRLGTELSRFRLTSGTKDAHSIISWEIHHALYDGWSFFGLLEAMKKAYEDESNDQPAPTQFQRFMQYLQNSDVSAAKEFWGSYFHASEASVFPALPSIDHTPLTDGHTKRVISTLQWPHNGITNSTMIRAAWSILQSAYTKTNDVSFGSIVTGRQADVVGIERVAGPTISTVPVRVNFESNTTTLLELQQHIQQSSTDTIAHEQVGLQFIRKISPEAAKACDFQTLLVVQPNQDTNHESNPVFELRAEGGGTAWLDSFSTYGLMLVCDLREDGVDVNISFDSSMIGESQVHRLAGQFEHLLRSICSDDTASQNLKVRDLDLMSPEDLQAIQAWNSKLPDSVDSCVHDIIAKNAVESPDADAVNAWDGTLTYSQLDQISGTLATRLQELGVGPNTIVPLYFEKSVWTPVAMLAVMKAGGASVALDPNQPEDRLRSIAEQAMARLIISSEANEEAALRLSTTTDATVVILGQKGTQLKNSVPKNSYQSARQTISRKVVPSDLLYLIFTSGSTGVPKGVQVSHANFASAIKHTSETLGFTKTSRVYDFGSYAFDMAWSNFILTLATGGCLCIPSETAMKNDTVASMKDFEVTFIQMTPSLARTLAISEVSTLDVVLLAGEAVTPADIRHVGNVGRVLNAYGPSECTPCATAEIIDVSGELSSVPIGKGLGLVTWLVDPDDNSKLAPLGIEGELWLEGPLVGKGYLGKPLLTEAAFVENPSWLKKITGRQGRLYQTGDIVRYAEDGSLLYVSRKDAQVKIRGQRVELSEVEHHIRKCLIEDREIQVVVEVVNLNSTGNATLLAFISLPDSEDQSDEALKTEIMSLTYGVKEQLSQAVPSYMIPSAFIPVQKMPMTATGKTDRKRLKEQSRNINLGDYVATSTNAKAAIAPNSSHEKILAEIWCDVLNISAADISIDTPFTSLGGDSITAMQVVSRCRGQKLAVTVSDILKLQTIQKIGQKCDKGNEDALSHKVDIVQEPLDGSSWGLSPIQTMFFENNNQNTYNHFNQSFLLRIQQKKSQISPDHIREAAAAIVDRHVMLRARFRVTAGQWQQYIPLETAGHDAFHFSHHSATKLEEVYQITQNRQKSLDITNGPVFAVDYFNIEDGIILLSAHHLVVDLMSWRVIWYELEQLLTGQSLEPVSLESNSFREWCRLQKQIAQGSTPESVLPFSIDTDSPYWDVAAEDNTVDASDTISYQINEATTSLLLGEANRAYGTEPIEAMLGILIHSLYQMFPNRPAPAVFLEGHGREPPASSALDLSDTVGWFTALLPLQVILSQQNTVADAVRYVKDARRQVPGKGIPYFAHRYLTKESEKQFEKQSNPFLLLNYSGKYQQLEGQDSFFAPIDFEIDASSARLRRTALIEINCQVENGKLCMSISMHKKMKHVERLKLEWINQLDTVFESATKSLMTASPQPTLSDLPLLQISNQGLIDLLNGTIKEIGISADNIAEIYPCTPLQEGFLLSTGKGAASYRVASIWDVSASSIDTSVSVERLINAWKQTIGRHSIFSVVHVEHPETGNMIQVQLKETAANIRLKQSSNLSPRKFLETMEEPEFIVGAPCYSVTLCSSESGDVSCRLDVHHALIDATSIPPLIRDVKNAYDNSISERGAPNFRDVIEHMLRTPQEETMDYWTKYLTEAQSTEVPESMFTHEESQAVYEHSHGSISISKSVTGAIAAFCREKTLTRSTFVQVAWALTLAYHLNRKDVAFGYVSSGRDLPIDRVHDIVGPLINSLVGRVNLDQSLQNILAGVTQSNIDHFQYQHISLAKIQKQLDLNGRKLFNTLVTLRDAHENSDSQAHADGSIQFHAVGGEDAHEYALTVTAGVTKDDTFLDIQYKHGYINLQSANQVAETFSSAIQYLIRERQGGSVFDRFYEFQTGHSMIAAEKFWNDQFTDLTARAFPPAPLSGNKPNCDRVVSLSPVALQSIPQQFPASLIWSAWAILSKLYTDSEDVIFGSIMATSCEAIPVRLVVDSKQHLSGWLDIVSSKKEKLYEFRRTPTSWISQISENAMDGCKFQSLIGPRNAIEANDFSRQYSIALAYEVSEDCLQINLHYDHTVISDAKAERLAKQLHHLTERLDLVEPNTAATVATLEVAGKEDLHDIWKWNAEIPDTAETSVTDLLTDTIQQPPSSPAICAWDGSLTYKELDDLTTKLAHHLSTNYSVGPGDVVPLCFEKSMYMPIAMLGVMKAGAASVALDPTNQPEERVRTVVQQVSPKVILTSALKTAMAKNIAESKTAVETIASATVDQWRVPPGARLAASKPSDLLYMVFTSGSTGVPKGVQIPHRSFASAMVHQADLVGFVEGSRVMDLASYAFDMLWYMFLFTFYKGGCMCIGSSEDIRNDPAAVMEQLDVSLAYIPPALTRVMDFGRLPKLRSIILGGEALNEADFHRFDALKGCKVLHNYGPSECTPTSTAIPLALGESNIPTLGRGVGLNTWVVSEEGSELVSIGAPGELWLEGPLVGDGYWRDEVKTRSSFIENPEWLLNGGPNVGGRCGRLYRTGDIVKYDMDGKLTFVRRKDTQVKIRGQRVELAEVEHHIRAALPTDQDILVIAEVVILKNTGKQALLAFIEHSSSTAAKDDTAISQLSQLTTGIEEQLQKVVPSYMIPSAFIPMAIPVSVTGKTDRKKLREIAAELNLNELTQGPRTASKPASSKEERILVTVWSKVLNIPSDEISVDVPFTRLGGDSITAMQVMSRCREDGLALSVSDILKLQTIEKIAPRAKRSIADSEAAATRLAKLGKIDREAWPLSPIQRNFFSNHPEGLDFFNQSFLLKLRKTFSVRDIRSALEYLIDRHPMLRAGFQQSSDGSWEQYLRQENTVDIAEYTCTNENAIYPIAQDRQSRLSITTGPLFAADVFFAEEEKSTVLLLTIHHLIVDLMSWRVIWHDMEQYLNGKQLLPAANINHFRAWSMIQAEIAQEANVQTVLPYTVKTDSEFWGVPSAENTYEACEYWATSLSQETTSSLLGQGNDSLRTEPIETMVAILMHSFKDAFPSQPAPAVILEGHGREVPEDIDASIDLSETVGWFTALLPLQIDLADGESIVNAAKLVKDARRSVPDKGIPYFAARYSGTTEEFRDHRDVLILFNYAGIYQQLEGSDSLFETLQLEQDIQQMSLKTHRQALIEINCTVEQGCLKMNVSTHKGMNHYDGVTGWIKSLKETFDNAMISLTEAAYTMTLSDLPLLDISYKGLEKMQRNLQNVGLDASTVADMYPSTATQEGILLSTSKGSASYCITWIWECNSNSEDPISVSQLENAWRGTLQNHSIFSTVFIEHPETGNMIQVLLKNLTPNVSLEQWQSSFESPERLLASIKTLDFKPEQPGYTVYICRSDDGRVACRMDVHHALVDAASVPVLIQSVADVYTNSRSTTETKAPEFRDVVKHLLSTPQHKKINYWKNFLTGVAPCNIPETQVGALEKGNHNNLTISSATTEKIGGWCKRNGVTRSTFLQVAWAMALSENLSDPVEDVCFGYMSSGRDLPLDHIHSTIGPMINMLIGRIDVSKALEDVLFSTNEDSINHFRFQHVSLVDMQRDLKLYGKRLFNTVMTIREAHEFEEDTSQGIRFAGVEGEDRHEFTMLCSGTILKDQTEVVLDYRVDLVEDQVARRIVQTFTEAMKYLMLETELDTRRSSSVSEDFFYSRTGVSKSDAAAFWESQLEACEPVTFPPSSHENETRNTTANIIRSTFDTTANLGETEGIASNLIKVAWALVIHSYTQSEDIIMGNVVEDSHENSVLTPLRLRFGKETSVKQLLSDAFTATEAIYIFRKVGINFIEHLGDVFKQACQFDSVVLPHDTVLETGSHSLVLKFDIRNPEKINLTLEFSNMVDYALASGMISQAKHFMSMLSAPKNAHRRIGDLEMICSEDLQTIWSWNETVPKTIEASIPDLLAPVFRERADDTAVCAWDGDLTYRQLNVASKALARRLIDSGVQSGEIVPLMFEKSVWMPVAMLAVTRAGAAAVTMDITQPMERLRTLVGQVASHAPLILSSSLAKGLALEVTTTTDSALQIMVPSDTIELYGEGTMAEDEEFHIDGVNIKPSDTLCLVFTSGTSGIPKASQLSHQNYASAVYHQREYFELDPTSKVLDFASYAFDVPWMNFVYVFTTGATLCIGSWDMMRDNLVGCLDKFDISHALLTPTLARSMNPSVLSRLKVLILGGEALLSSDRRLFGSAQKTFNVYGPSECTAVSMSTMVGLEVEGKPSIGVGRGQNIWVVDPADHGRLVPVGGEGELLLEGPLVGLGYFQNLEKNLETFITETPVWLTQGFGKVSGRPSRLYKTGDLVRYRSDGSLDYVGRKDGQVKLRGQRLELAEVEHHVRKALMEKFSTEAHVVAEVITPMNASAPILVAFIAISKGFRLDVMKLEQYISASVPSYMVPTAFIAVDAIPTTATGKVDRRDLKRRGGKMTREEIAALSSGNSCLPGQEQVQPTTVNETKLQKLWASVLGIQTVSDIGKTDNFLRIGGDSVLAMRLVSEAREEGLQLSVAQIFKCPRLEEMALLLDSNDGQDQLDSISSIAPFSLLDSTLGSSGLQKQAAILCGVDVSTVEDVLPCTSLQAGLLAMTLQRPDENLYVSKNKFKLKPTVDISKVYKACEDLVAKTPILRTRIVDMPNHGLVQVVLVESMTRLDDGQDQYMGLGTSLSRFRIQDDELCWDIHHALYDGWSMPLMMHDLQQAYYDELSAVGKPVASFQHFIRHVLNVERSASEAFWKSCFNGSEAVVFPQANFTNIYASCRPSVRSQNSEH